jgi:hypothetical protein
MTGTRKMENPPRMVRAGGVEREARRDTNRRRALRTTRAVGQFQTEANCRRAELTSLGSMNCLCQATSRQLLVAASVRTRLGGRAGAACDFGLVSAETFSVCRTAARSIVTS